MKKKAILEVATCDLTCSICNGLIPEGDRYWFRPATNRGEHTNCELYTVDYIKKQIHQEKVNGSR